MAGMQACPVPRAATFTLTVSRTMGHVTQGLLHDTNNAPPALPAGRTGLVSAFAAQPRYNLYGGLPVVPHPAILSQIATKSPSLAN